MALLILSSLRYEQGCFSTVAVAKWAAGSPYGSIVCSLKMGFSGPTASYKGSICKQNLWSIYNENQKYSALLPIRIQKLHGFSTKLDMG